MSTPVNAARQALFTDILTDANTRQSAISVPTPGKGNWISFASGPFGNWDLTVSDGRLRVDAYIDTYNRDVNNALFDEFAADAASWQTKLGLELSWERLDDKRASRIATYRPVDLDDPVDRDVARQWAVDALVAMYNTLNTPLRAAAEVGRAEFADPAPPRESQTW